MSARSGIGGTKVILGLIWGHPRPFFMDRKHLKVVLKNCLLPLVGQWALFTRFGPLLLSTQGGDRDFPTYLIDFENFYFLDFLGPHLGPDLGPAWAQLRPRLGPRLGPSLGPAWAQTPPAAPLDKFSDPNLTPLPTHPGIKYVARTLAAI